MRVANQAFPGDSGGGVFLNGVHIGNNFSISNTNPGTNVALNPLTIAENQ